MSKKKTVIEEVKVTQLAKPEVSNSINLNLNQNDIIEVAIQEYLTVLEPKLKAAEDRVIAIKKLYQEKITELTNKHCDTTKRKDLDVFKKFCKDHGLEYSFGVYYKHNNDTRRTYKLAQFQQAEQHKDPSSWMRRQTYEQSFLVEAPMTVNSVSSYSKDKDQKVSIFTLTLGNLRIEVSESAQNAYMKEMHPIADEWVDAHNDLFNVQTEYLEYKYNDKKIKAKVVKESLSRSEEGRGILSLLQSATNVKLLG